MRFARASRWSRSGQAAVRRCGADAGGVTTFVVLLVVPMVMMAGLAFDGGQLLAARRQAYDVAQNAALAGAQAIDGPEVRQGNVVADPEGVHVAATRYLDSTGHVGTVTVSGETVTVSVTTTVELQLLSVIGISEKTVTGTARTRLVRGVDGPET